jgi:glycosyltransferase involved in cell wall biosynthesis
MSTAPRLSVGLPVYNGEKYLAQSIDALLGQSYEDFELIISDNASNDGTAGICRRYEKQDSRVRYIRQRYNVGCALNHNLLVGQARGELFKWASCDDLYARDLLKCCVEALDEYPDVVLAHSWTATINSSGAVTRAMEYSLATDSTRPPERFRSMLFANHSDDSYGVIRADVLRRVKPHDSYYHAERTFTAEIGLQGPFYLVPDWLYFRRDHPDRALRAHPTVRSWCANLDPRRMDRLRHPVPRLYAEYVWGFIAAIRRAPLSSADRLACYLYLAEWAGDRGLRGRPRPDGADDWTPAADMLIDAVVAGPKTQHNGTVTTAASRRPDLVAPLDGLGAQSPHD